MCVQFKRAAQMLFPTQHMQMCDALGLEASWSVLGRGLMLPKPLPARPSTIRAEATWVPGEK